MLSFSARRWEFFYPQISQISADLSAALTALRQELPTFFCLGKIDADVVILCDAKRLCTNRKDLSVMHFWWFWIRKLLSRVIFPVPLILELLLLGIVLQRMQRAPRAARIVLVVAVGLLFVLSLPICSNWAFARLERSYPPLLEAQIVDLLRENDGAPVHIAVAGSGFYLREGLADAAGRPADADLSHGLNEAYLVRLQEAGRIAHLVQEHGGRCQLLVASYSSVEPALRQRAFAAYFSAFGIAAEDVLLIDGAYNSKREVERFGEHSRRFVMVSSAAHVSRLLGFAQRRGFDAIAAPAGYRCRPGAAVGSIDFIPSAEGLYNVRILFYELLGRLER
jgi:uncharacterized SAM-binding protein YcdF (DUF218 family)